MGTILAVTNGMRRIALIGIMFTAVLATIFAARPAIAMGPMATQDEVCDTAADYFLGDENYPEAVKSHRLVIAAHPDDALAHYHLGFALGMLGRHAEELAEYRDAARLGLGHWDLFLNLGRVYLEQGDLGAATGALETAVSLGPDHAEAHFNLGLVYERRGMIAHAQRQILASLRLDPGAPDARNMLGLVYAEEGDFAQARKVWTELGRSEPDFGPARANLALLDLAEHRTDESLSSRAAGFRTASSGGPR